MQTPHYQLHTPKAVKILKETGYYGTTFGRIVPDFANLASPETG